MKNHLLIISLLFTSYSCFAELKLPSFFSDNMMLQQNENVSIWGEDEPNTKVSVLGSWGKELSTITDSRGSWRIKIPTPSAGLNHDITIKGSSVKKIKNVSIGDVWLCSGQSNMKFSLKGNINQAVIGSNEAILNAENKNIRLFKVAETLSLTPENDVAGEWEQATPASVATFGATCYFFGKKLNDVLDSPVGLILSAYGASSAEAWTPNEVLSTLGFTPLESDIRKVRPQTTPTALYNAMIHPFIGYTIKGFTWYQGENNRPRASQYTELFSAMIHSWRNKWKQGSLPFYFAQLAPYGNNKDIDGALLRETQLQTMLNVENTGMVSLMDSGMCNFIHPPYKKVVGDRLAYWALAKNYNYNAIAYSGPILDTFETLDNKMSIKFKYADYGLTSFGKKLTGFSIAGKDKVFHPAEVKIEKNKSVTVWAKKVKKPVAVRYGFENCPVATLYNTEGLPATSFRTDNWAE